MLNVHVGEANVGMWQQYNCSFPAMISDWRSKFNVNSNGVTDAQFPFGFVQVEITHGRRNRGQGVCVQLPPPQYFANRKNISLKITTYNSMYSNKAKVGS